MGKDSAIRAVLRDKMLRRLQYAVIGSMLGRTAFMVALGVWAFREDGAALVGIAGFVRMAPAAIVAPFAATLADRYPRNRVMAASESSRAALCFATAAAVAAGAPVVVVLVLIGLISLAGALFEPAKSAIVPSLVERPEQLAAVNATSSAVNSITYFLGPALGALLLVVSSVQVTFVGTGIGLLWSAAFALSLRPRADNATTTAPEPGGWLDEVRAGLVVVRDDRGLLLLIMLFGLQTFIAGAVTVFTVVIALDLLDAGQGWVGILDAMAGIGAFAGVAVVTRVTANERLSTGVITGLVLWGVPLALIGIWDVRAAAVLAMLLIGVGDTIIDVSSITLVQRIVPEHLLGRVFGLAETVIIGGMAAGALLAPVVIELLGIQGALIAFACLPGVALLAVGALRALDARAVVDERPRALLRGLPMFAALPLPVLDGLAMALRPVDVPDGTAVVTQGEAGDRYYVIDEGEVDVFVDGNPVSRLGAGEGFGEIALLRDVPRVASVAARGPVKLLALERDTFLPAVTGHVGASMAADTVMSGYRTRVAAPAPAPQPA